MYLIYFHVRIKPNSVAAERFKDIGGAYVNFYIQFKDYEASEKLAKLLVKEQGWLPTGRVEAWHHYKKDCKTKKQKQYYEEALKYGYSVVFHMYPKDAADEDHAEAKQRSERAQSK